MLPRLDERFRHAAEPVTIVAMARRRASNYAIQRSASRRRTMIDDALGTGRQRLCLEYFEIFSSPPPMITFAMRAVFLSLYSPPPIAVIALMRVCTC